MISRIRIGTAGWAIPSSAAPDFPSNGSTLERYASVFNAAEINSTFRRSHRAATYRRWSTTVPADFEFSVKVPKTITHMARLVSRDDAVALFHDEIANLGSTLGPLLLKLHPSLPFEADVLEPLCRSLSQSGRFQIACEPRHSSWFNVEVDQWLAARRIARVASDPARHPGAEIPGGWRGLTYFRLHGSPRMYYSSYDSEALAQLEAQLVSDPADRIWCIFDNTASGAAAGNARLLRARVGESSSHRAAWG